MVTRKYVVIAALTTLMSTAAMAQTTAPQPATPAAPAAAPVATTAAPSAASLKLTEAEAKAWIDKVIYSSDGKNVGEVAAFARDGSGNVTEMHGDVGGFLGLGETRVKFMPADFKLATDRVTLNLTAEQVKALPHLPK